MKDGCEVPVNEMSCSSIDMLIYNRIIHVLLTVVPLLPNLYGAYEVQITDLKVPAEVQNGTSHVILDCEYTVRQAAELSSRSGLVVKWFFNNEGTPVYQWIPGQKPQDLGILRGRLLLDYKASNHSTTKHRALYIINPTIELSGEYKCSVSTFTDEDFMIKKMTVYSLEKAWKMYHVKTDSHSVINITCLAQGVFPEPRMSLAKGVDEKSLQEMADVSVQNAKRGDGAYDISASAVLQESDLNISFAVDCELWIPSIKYRKHLTKQYNPGQALPEMWTDTATATSLRGQFLCQGTLLLLFCHYFC